MPANAQSKRKRKDNQPFNPGRGPWLLARQREAAAMKLRVSGRSYDEIGRALKVTEQAAYAMIMRLLTKFNDDIKESIPQARQIEIQRCDQLLSYTWKGVKAGNAKSIAVALKIEERRAKLLGLDMPQEHKLRGIGEGGAITIEVFRRMTAEDGEEGRAA